MTATINIKSYPKKYPIINSGKKIKVDSNNTEYVFKFSNSI